MAERFSDSDPVEEILRIAVQNSGMDDATLRQRLLASAAELGISEEQALAAQQEWEVRKSHESEVVAYRRHVSEEFWSHAKAFALTNFIMLFINLMVSGGRITWAVYPLGVWGVILVVHALVAISQFRNPSGEEFESFRKSRKARKPKKSGLTIGVHIGELGTRDGDLDP